MVVVVAAATLQLTLLQRRCIVEATWNVVVATVTAAENGDADFGHGANGTFRPLFLCHKTQVTTFLCREVSSCRTRAT